MKKRIAICLLCVMLFSNGFAADKLTDRADLHDAISSCDQFDDYTDIAQALLCAAAIPYGKTLEECIQILQGKGFAFEYRIGNELPYDASPFDVEYTAEGIPQLPMIREAELVFSSNAFLYLRTETMMVSVENISPKEDITLWTPAEELTGGKACAAHLQYLEQSTGEWITWTLSSSERYKAA